MATQIDKAWVEEVAAHHNEQGREKYYNWIRTCITILTPSLALLIGLQDKDEDLTWVSLTFLVSSILFITVSILLGFLILNSEEKSHVLARNSIIDQFNRGEDRKIIESSRVKLPTVYNIAMEWFSHIFWYSIFLLGGFGMTKFII